MSARRAAIRRERAQRAKAEKNKTPEGKLERARNRGIIDGRVIASSVILELLHDRYGFSCKKAQELLDHVGKESTKCDQDGTRFVMEFYSGKLSEKINSVEVYQEMKDVETQVYCVARDEMFVTAAAIMCDALNELYGFSSFSTGTGRLDYIMEYCVNRYIEVQLDPEHKTADYYFRKMKRNTGYNIE